MIKRLTATLGLIICLCFTAMANKEITVKLDKNHKVYREKIGFAYLTFEYMYHSGNTARVLVTVENITSDPPLAVIAFRKDMPEENLLIGKPKIEFEKTYPGKKGARTVKGFSECNRNIFIFPAAVTDTITTLDVSLTTPKKFTLPLYEAKYKPKNLFKKGLYNIPYKIMEEHLYDVNVEVEVWTEDDPTYAGTKQAVESFISSLDGVRFCDNPKHIPSLREQQRPYIEKRDSLLRVIEANLSLWMSDQDPYKAFSHLWSELEAINFNSMTYDCGEHKVKPKTPSCGYCPLSAREIYQRLDDLYQQLYAGKITKSQALGTANGLYNCYQQHKPQRKDGSYGAKITKFYNSIANF